MKKIFIAFMAFAVLFGFNSCKNDEPKKHVMVKGKTRGLSEGTYDTALYNEDVIGWKTGKATFTGEKPRYQMVVGSMTVYYHKSCKKYRQNGDISIWKIEGDACVTFGKKADAEKNRFKIVNGTLQTQNLF